MKTLFTSLLLCLFILPLSAQVKLETVSITENTLDVNTAVSAAEITMTIEEPGTIVAKFNGSAIVDFGDRIDFYISTTGAFQEGWTQVEALNDNIKERSFSITKVYENVAPGNFTLHAVAENFLETDGDGLIGLFANFTLEFVAQTLQNAGDFMVRSDYVDLNNIDLSSVTTLSSQSITTTKPGLAIVRFDGFCSSDVGDRIVVAASDTPDWGVNDGNVNFEAFDSDINTNTFSHTRVYPIGAGTHTFYAVAQNYVESDGNGIATIIGDLTIEIVANSIGAEMLYVPVSTTNINADNLQNLAVTAINTTDPGMAYVQFDGFVVSDDLNELSIGINTSASLSTIGNTVVILETGSDDINRASFCLSRVFPLESGVNSFYGLIKNSSLSSGDDIASVYGILTTTIIPEIFTDIAELPFDQDLQVFPNPASEFVSITGLPQQFVEEYSVHIINQKGETIGSYNLSGNDQTINVTKFVNGIYTLQVFDKNKNLLAYKPIVKIK